MGETVDQRKHTADEDDEFACGSEANRNAAIEAVGEAVASKVIWLLKVPIVKKFVDAAIKEVVDEIQNNDLTYRDVPEIAGWAWQKLGSLGLIKKEKQDQSKPSVS